MYKCKVSLRSFAFSPHQKSHYHFPFAIRLFFLFFCEAGACWICVYNYSRPRCIRNYRFTSTAYTNRKWKWTVFIENQFFCQYKLLPKINCWGSGVWALEAIHFIFTHVVCFRLWKWLFWFGIIRAMVIGAEAEHLSRWCTGCENIINTEWVAI